MAHVLAGTFKQAHWIREFGSTEKSDIDVVFERIDIGESGISNARGRAAVMQQFEYIISTIAIISNQCRAIAPSGPECSFNQAVIAGSRLTEPLNRKI
jgi:hypothetical protein